MMDLKKQKSRKLFIFAGSELVYTLWAAAVNTDAISRGHNFYGVLGDSIFDECW